MNIICFMLTDGESIILLTLKYNYCKCSTTAILLQTFANFTFTDLIPVGGRSLLFPFDGSSK